MVKDGFALPVGGFEVAVFGALFGYLDFAVYVAELGVYFLLAFRTYTFGFTQLSSTPARPSAINAKGSSIIDMVTMRSYLRIFCTVDPEVNKRTAE